MFINFNKYVIIIVFLITAFAKAQNDSIQLKNNDILVGEVKSFSTGILVLKTSYSDEDFKIEFNKVKWFAIKRKCLIILTEGRRRFGYIKTNEQNKVVIISEDNGIEYFEIEEIIALQEIYDKFFRRIKGSIDLGYDFTKADNNTQFTIAGQFDYASEKWLLDGNINLLSSTQDDAEDIKRADANLGLKRILPKKWYLLGGVYFLSNTEQALDSRINPSIGLGKLIRSTNKLIFGVDAGYAYNIEDYVDKSLNKSSSEVFASSNFNMFDFKDFDLKTGIKVYLSLSEKGRVRTDYDLTIKYDLPLDFYIKLGFTLNYDNQPAIEGNDFDYIFKSGVGWEFN